MNLFGKRAKGVELPSGSSAALAAGLYAGSYAGVASAGFGDDGTVGDEGASDQPANADNGLRAQVARNPAVDSGAGSGSDTSWSGSDGAGGGNWWDDGGWSGGDFTGGG